MKLSPHPPSIANGSYGSLAEATPDLESYRPQNCSQRGVAICWMLPHKRDDAKAVTDGFPQSRVLSAEYHGASISRTTGQGVSANCKDSRSR